jgi:hypothetical protein
LASANLGAASVSTFLANVEPVMHALISLAQLAIATVTVWYIVRRTRQLSRAAKVETRKVEDQQLVDKTRKEMTDVGAGI